MIETAPTATAVPAGAVVSPEVVNLVQPATGRLGVVVRADALPARHRLGDPRALTSGGSEGQRIKARVSGLPPAFGGSDD